MRVETSFNRFALARRRAIREFVQAQTLHTILNGTRRRAAVEKEAERTRELFLYPSWMVIGAVTFLSVSGVQVPSVFAWVPFLLSAVFLGLPHGAVDHIVLVRLRGEPLGVRSVIKAVVPYVLIGGGYFLVWIVAPILAFALFIAMTWYHWGQGDMVALLQFGRVRHLESRFQKAMTIVLRGAIPMLIPFVASPSEYIAAANLIINSVTTGGKDLAWIMPSASSRFGIGIGIILVALAHYGVGILRAHEVERRAWLEDFFETALLIVFFASVNPVFAAGLYFCVWHSTRHIARLIEVEKQHEPAGTLTRRSLNVFTYAIPTTIAAVLLLVALFVAVPSTPDTIPQMVSLYLVLVSVLTLPHVWVVTRMDLSDKVWRRGL